MKIWWKKPSCLFDVHDENNQFYFSYKTIDRELVTYSFEKIRSPELFQTYEEHSGKYKCNKCGLPITREQTCVAKCGYTYTVDWKAGIYEFRPTKIGEKHHLDEKYFENPANNELNWMRNYQDSYIHHVEACNNCKLFMWHSLNYCHKCGGTFKKMKIPMDEMKTTYKDWKFGF